MCGRRFSENPGATVIGATMLSLLLAVSAPVDVSGQPAVTSDQPTLTIEAMTRFLREAEIVKSEPIGTGVTAPWRLTLSDGTLTHDAALNVVNIFKTRETFEDGTFEMNFVDAYRYNIAAYRLSRLLGMTDAVPVMIEREWNNKIGSLSWWLDDSMTEGERIKAELSPPRMLDWTRAIYRVRVFNNLVYDSDRNLGNMLIADWHCWMIDFTRAFRLWEKLPAQSDLNQIDRVLLASLRVLTQETIAEATNPHLRDTEIEALLSRRDLIVAHFDQLIAERGEGAVVYTGPWDQ